MSRAISGMVRTKLVRSGLYTPGVALSTTEFAILGLLSGGECSGYDLKKSAEAGIGYVWTAAKSQVYAVLPRLVAGGYATAKHVRQERFPDKQVYRITRRGEEAFGVWLEEPVDYFSSRSPFLLKVFFGEKMSRECSSGTSGASARPRRRSSPSTARSRRGSRTTTQLLRLRDIALGDRAGAGVDPLGRRLSRGARSAMRWVVAAAAALVLVPSATAYKNPTPGRALVVQIAGMHRAKVTYRGGLDVYRPRSAKGRLPAVLLGGRRGRRRRSAGRS